VLEGDRQGGVAVRAKEARIEWGRASKGRWALFFEAGLG